MSDLVLNGAGVAVVDPFMALMHVRRGRVSVRLSLAITFRVDPIAHADSRLGEAANALLEQVALQVKCVAD